ncbi:hypothetical protein GpartN1_g540.t1 [Galdieria partita]|uniref:Uncharacterized protein n=1 Tax=Galdieria partita TaxID=83374 RepID=A0A9C7PR87_9RHOD|nr:hypothetical protein GpartN1_g540.t1 [Galdieria partita]
MSCRLTLVARCTLATWLKPKLRKKIFAKPEKPPKEQTLSLSSVDTKNDASFDSFLSLFRKTAFCKPIHEGAVLKGSVVGSRYDLLGSDRVRTIDFGLKGEAPLAIEEIPGNSIVGSTIYVPLVRIENEFAEPEVDYSGLMTLPKSLADRTQLLLFPGSDPDSKKSLRLAFGRVSKISSGSISVRVLGFDFNVSQAHFISFEKPSVGSQIPLMIYNLSARTLFSSASSVNDLNLLPESIHLELTGRASPYAAYVLLLSYLAYPAAFSQFSKEGFQISPKERLIYLKQLSRILEGTSLPTTTRSLRSQRGPTFF